ncbi:MAG: hypothetical protein Q9222_003343 [Ikaeria aurantiellina]
MASESGKPITLANIPTLSQLYKSGSLAHGNADFKPYEPSATLNQKISIIQTSITDLEVTSIVNAANTSLLGGGGVDGAIHGAAGPDLLKECRTLDGCRTGSAKMTSAYRLPSKYVIHAVGPVYLREEQRDPGRATDLLTSCYQTSLELAADKGGSIAFSCLSTGIYGYPSDEAADIACQTVRDFLVSEKGKMLDRVIFCCFLDKDMRDIFFPPTVDDDPASHETSQSHAENEANVDTHDNELEHGASAPAPVDEPEQDSWVEVEKPDTPTYSSKPSNPSNNSASQIVDAKMQSSDDDIKKGPEPSLDKADPPQYNKGAEHGLLKDCFRTSVFLSTFTYFHRYNPPSASFHSMASSPTKRRADELDARSSPPPNPVSEASSSSLSSLSSSPSPLPEHSSEPKKKPHIDEFGLEQPPPMSNLEGRYNTSRETGRRQIYGLAREMFPSHHIPYDYWQGHRNSTASISAFKEVIDRIQALQKTIGKDETDKSTEAGYLKDVHDFVNESCSLTERDRSGRRRSLESRMEDLLKEYGFDQVGAKDKKIEQYEKEKGVEMEKGVEREKGVDREKEEALNLDGTAEGKDKVVPQEVDSSKDAEEEKRKPEISDLF